MCLILRVREKSREAQECSLLQAECRFPFGFEVGRVLNWGLAELATRAVCRADPPIWRIW